VISPIDVPSILDGVFRPSISLNSRIVEALTIRWKDGRSDSSSSSSSISSSSASTSSIFTVPFLPFPLL